MLWWEVCCACSLVLPMKNEFLQVGRYSPPYEWIAQHLSERTPKNLYPSVSLGFSLLRA
jgi:hypothetical protein